MANLTLRQIKGSPLTITEMDGNFEYFTGSYTNTGTITAQGFSGSFTGSLQGTAQTASYVQTAQTASYVQTAQTASYVQIAQTASYVQTAQTASYVQTAQTASYVTKLNQNVIISGSLTITGSLILSSTHSVAPSYTGVNGEIVSAKVGSQYLLYMWMDSAWRSSSFV
jgi:hypothetical protein